MTFLFLTFLSILIQGLFALFEMAALSMNRLRLKYYASSGNKRALWLSKLIVNPSRFFGTTLIGVNAALQIGSECSRKFYESIHIDPDFAPITQVIFVVIFAELVPMFAARRHPSQIALSLVPAMSVISKLMIPFIWIFEGISRLGSRWAKETPSLYTREEVATAFSQREESHDELNALTEGIFQLKNKNASQVMTPLEQVEVFSSKTTVNEIRLRKGYEPIIPIYLHKKTHIVAIAYVRDLLKLKSSSPIFSQGKTPWFVAETMSVLEILNQFRRNSQSAAIVLDSSGMATGILTLDLIISEIFGQGRGGSKEMSLYIERTVNGEIPIPQFNREFQCDWKVKEKTLNELLYSKLGHLPATGDTVRIDPFIFTIIEPTLKGAGIISVRTVND